MDEERPDTNVHGEAAGAIGDDDATPSIEVPTQSRSALNVREKPSPPATSSPRVPGAPCATTAATPAPARPPASAAGRRHRSRPHPILSRGQRPCTRATGRDPSPRRGPRRRPRRRSCAGPGCEERHAGDQGPAGVVGVDHRGADVAAERQRAIAAGEGRAGAPAPEGDDAPAARLAVQRERRTRERVGAQARLQQTSARGQAAGNRPGRSQRSGAGRRHRQAAAGERRRAGGTQADHQPGQLGDSLVVVIAVAAVVLLLILLQLLAKVDAHLRVLLGLGRGGPVSLRWRRRQLTRIIHEGS